MTSDEDNEPFAPSTAKSGGVTTETSDGATRLLHLAALAEELGATRVADDARELAARISEGRFYVACVGQFKRGKSTLINALIGRSVLPTGFTPVTSVPTVVRYGESLTARIRVEHGAWSEIAVSELDQYVSEELNPENKKAVHGAEVLLPSPLLASGMCLVDTPGLGSVFAGNTAAAQAFIPHIDAALVVIGASPPLAGEELSLVETVGKQVQNLILVLNKADRTTDAERHAAVRFTRELLEKRLHREVGPVFEVSAVEMAEHRGSERDASKLSSTLQGLVNESRWHLVQSACERGLQRLSEQLRLLICEERDALKRPIEDSERRIAAMKQTISEAERAMRDLAFLFVAEQQRLSDLFDQQRKTFLAAVASNANRELEESLRSHSRVSGPSYRRQIMRRAQEIARSYVSPWLKSEQEAAEKEYQQAVVRFVDLGNNFLKRLAKAGVPGLARMPHALDPESGFRVRSRFTFMDFIEIAQPASPLQWLLDLILGVIGARKMIDNDAREFLAWLLESNSIRVQSDILNRVQESRGQLETEIRRLLHEVSRIAEEALMRASKIKHEGEPAVRAALDRLEIAERNIFTYTVPAQ